MARRVAIGAVTALLHACAMGAAWAAPGDHIRLGELELKPSVTFVLEYHTNVYLLAEEPEPGMSIGLSPKLDISGEKPDWQFRAGAAYAPRKFLDLDPKDEANVQNLDRWNEMSANAGFNVLRRSVLGFRADDSFQIINTPAELETADHSANIVTISNDLNGGVLIRPGSAIEVGALGQFGVDDYNVPPEIAEQTLNPNFNNRASYGPALEAQWRFLPRTALKGSGGVTWNRWSSNLIRAAGPEVEGVDYGEYLGKPDSITWRTLWGVKGQFTEKISAEIAAGYGQAYYDEQSVLDSAQAATILDSSQELDLTGVESNGETFGRDLTSFGEGLLVRLQVGWQPIPHHVLNLGYKKDFQDAFFTNYVNYSYVFGRYEGMFFERVGVLAELGFRLDAFHGEVARKDANYNAKLSGTYNFTKFLFANASLGWKARACGDADCQAGAYETTRYSDVAVTGALTILY